MWCSYYYNLTTDMDIPYQYFILFTPFGFPGHARLPLGLPQPQDL